MLFYLSPCSGLRKITRGHLRPGRDELFQVSCLIKHKIFFICSCLKPWLRVWGGLSCLLPVVHGGPLEEQEPSGAGVGGPVLLPGGAQRLQRGPGRAQLQEEPLRHRGCMWVHVQGRSMCETSGWGWVNCKKKRLMSLWGGYCISF